MKYYDIFTKILKFKNKYELFIKKPIIIKMKNCFISGTDVVANEDVTSEATKYINDLAELIALVFEFAYTNKIYITYNAFDGSYSLKAPDAFNKELSKDVSIDVDESVIDIDFTPSLMSVRGQYFSDKGYHLSSTYSTMEFNNAELHVDSNVKEYLFNKIVSMLPDDYRDDARALLFKDLVCVGLLKIERQCQRDFKRACRWAKKRAKNK